MVKRMNDSRFKWELAKDADPAAVAALTKAGLSPVLADLLVKRGLKTSEAAQQFLQPDPNLIHDPHQLHDMDKAVDRIQQAIERGEQITIYGDYDAEGITSTAVMYETLQEIGANVNYYIPNRFNDGYGPNAAAYQRLIEEGTQLIVTVDNGVSGKTVIDPVMKQGVDVVVTDHHELPAELPNAVAVVHPQYPGTDYPFAGLSGVGVAFKLAWALTDEFPQELLDLVAIGEIADVVSVADENRVLISLGLQVLRQGMRPGLHELVKLAGLNEARLTDQDIGFGIAPRLNALGRVADAGLGVQLLTTFDEGEGQELAKQVEAANQQRRQLVDTIMQPALAQASSAKNQEHAVLILLGHDWHQGVLGIVASRVREQTGKPTIVASVDSGQEVAKASGRSDERFNLFAALDPHRELLTTFGGHPAACGLSFAVDKLDQLQAALDAEAVRQGFDWEKPLPLKLAAKLSPDQVNEELYNDLQKLAPFGPDNEEPVFELANIHPAGVRTMGKDNSHLKFGLRGQQKLAVIAFGHGQDAPLFQAPGNQVDIAATIGINEWQGQRTVQLMLVDAHVYGPLVLDERTTHLRPEHFKADGEYIVYDDRLRANIAPHVGADHALSPAAAQGMDLSHRRVTLVDLPDSLDALRKLFQNDKGAPAQIRLLLMDRQNVYLAGLPDRQSFAGVYGFLRANPRLQWPQQAPAVSQYLKINPTRLNLIIQVFSEAGFVTISNGVLNLQPVSGKTDLKQTTQYQKQLARYQAEKVLLYGDATSVAQWILQCLKKD
jgi:single-stranded-DNA-specific exonuclease